MLKVAKIGITLSILLLLTACGRSNDATATAFLNQLKATFEENTVPIKLSQLTNFEWGEVCYFGWDDSEEGWAIRAYKARVDRKYILADSINIENKDYQHLFVFLKNKKPVHHIGIMRNNISFKNGLNAYITLQYEERIPQDNTKRDVNCMKSQNATLSIATVMDRKRPNRISHAIISLYDTKAYKDQKY